MTTLVYEGETKTIYADSMVTTKVAGVHTRVDMTYKVEDLSRLDLVSSEGERIIATAYSGSVMMFNRITKFILSHLHNWTDAVSQLLEQGVQLNDFAGCSVMLVTDKQLHCFRFSTASVDVESLDLDENVTFGSGAAFAKAAMEVFGADGFDAIATAAMCDPDTGCLVHKYTIEDDKLVSHAPVLYLDSEETRLVMRKRAAESNRNVKVSDLFDITPENILVNLHHDSPMIKKVRERNRIAWEENSKPPDVHTTEPA